MSNGLEFPFHVSEIEPLDQAWLLLIGDAYHKLRTALDQLVYQLHVRHFRGTVPPSVEATRCSLCRRAYRDLRRRRHSTERVRDIGFEALKRRWLHHADAALQAARFPNFDPAEFARSKDTVYICVPGTAHAMYAPWSSHSSTK